MFAAVAVAGVINLKAASSFPVPRVVAKDVGAAVAVVQPQSFVPLKQSGNLGTPTPDSDRRLKARLLHLLDTVARLKESAGVERATLLNRQNSAHSLHTAKIVSSSADEASLSRRVCYQGRRTSRLQWA